MRITDTEIAKQKQIRPPKKGEKSEHNDCIRIAYEWLDAQAKVRTVSRRSLPLKHIIETWGGRYVSAYDVEIAAQMHDGVTGAYPFYNLSARLIRPAEFRLEDIGEAGSHKEVGDRSDQYEVYKAQE